MIIVENWHKYIKIKDDNKSTYNSHHWAIDVFDVYSSGLHINIFHNYICKHTCQDILCKPELRFRYVWCMLLGVTPTQFLLITNIYLLLQDSQGNWELYENGIKGMCKFRVQTDIVMSSKLWMCVWSVVPPVKNKVSKETYGFHEKQFILNIKLVGPNSETETEGESNDSGFKCSYNFISHPSYSQCPRLVHSGEDIDEAKVRA